MTVDAYKRLAERLDSLPNGFPATADGVELRILAKLFSPEDAALAGLLESDLEPVSEIAARAGEDPKTAAGRLKSMARRGLINWGRTGKGMGYGILPFVVGIYEMQAGEIDAELAELFEKYYRQVFGESLSMQPAFHRVIPVGEAVGSDLEVLPFESAAEILGTARSWGVVDCICRKQKALIGDPCDHPLDVCLAMAQEPNAFDHSPTVRALTFDGAVAALRRAAEAGLVHSVSNRQRGHWYICNCCTCSCAILRAMAELGSAQVIARSAFVNRVSDDLCTGCELCLDRCQFNALSLNGIIRVDPAKCVGCGLCVPACAEGALALVRRPAGEVVPPPISEADWLKMRAQARGIPWESAV